MKKSEVSQFISSPTGTLTLLGMDKTAGVPLWVFSEGAKFFEWKDAMGLIPPDQVPTFVWARSLILHQTSWKFCPHCSGQLFAAEGGLSKLCNSCKAGWYPRVDPCIITLITNHQSCLLVRLPNWSPTRHSCVAGFLESGENIEDCVTREVFEEVGITIKPEQVRYIKSEPWPTAIASNLMVGCQIEVPDQTFNVSVHEVAEARWFQKSEINEIMDWMKHRNGRTPEYELPGPWTTSYKLLSAWAQNQLSTKE